MRVLVQRVSRAGVRVDGCEVGAIDRGLLLLVGIGGEDDESVLAPMAAKIANMRIFPPEGDGDGHFDRSLLDVGGAVLAVSQFTLHANCRKGRRPSFSDAARPERASELFDGFVEAMRALGPTVETGEFGAMMEVELVNDGPVTIWLDSREVLARG